MIAYLNNKKIRKVDFHKLVTATTEIEIPVEKTVVVEKIAGYPSKEELAANYNTNNGFEWSSEGYLITPTGQFVTTSEWQNVYFNYDSGGWEGQRRTDGSEYNTYNAYNIEELRNYLTFSGNTYKMLCETSDVATNEWGKHDVTVVRPSSISELTEMDISGNTHIYNVDYSHEYHLYTPNDWGDYDQLYFYNPYNSNEYSTFYATYKEDKSVKRRIFLSDLVNMQSNTLDCVNIDINSTECGAFEIVDDDTIMFKYQNGTTNYSNISVGKFANLFYDGNYYPNIVYEPYNTNTYIYVCPFEKGFDTITIKNPDTPLTITTYMFDSCIGLQNIKGLNKLDVSNVTVMANMFENCSGLTSLDLSNWKTSNVTNMSQLFLNCKKLRKINLGDFDTTSISAENKMSNMFGNCGELRQLIWNNMANGENVTKIEIDQYYLGDENINDNKYIDDLRNTFVYNSFDRASAGYATCILDLNNHTVSKFSDEEIAQITAKGFTIA